MPIRASGSACRRVNGLVVRVDLVKEFEQAHEIEWTFGSANKSANNRGASSQHMAPFTEEAASDAPRSTQIATWRRGACVLIFLCLGCLLQGATYSHVTSFFNVYALEQKGLSSAEYGVIMGSYCFVIVFVTPLTARIVNLKCFKDKTLLLVGWAIDAMFCLLMSFTHHLAQRHAFFFGSLILRGLEATGCAIGFLMLYVITGLELNAINHIVIPLLETIYGVSIVLGPAVSGMLFDLGGYPLPFWAMGATLLTTLFLAMFLFPKPVKTPPEEDAAKHGGISQAWRIPVIVNVLCTMSAFAVISFNDSTLAMRMKVKFGMNATESGLLFLYCGGTYAIFGLLLGLISKRIPDLRYLVFSGQLLTLVALTLQGPLIPMEQTKGIVILAQILLGASAGPSFVCSYMQSLRYLSNGEETKEMYAALSALFTPACSIGCSIGPFMSGIILDHYSYEVAVAVNVVQTALMALLLISTICVCDKTVKHFDRSALKSDDQISVRT